MHFASVAALVLGVELYDFVGWTLYPIILNRFCEMVAFMCLRGQHPTTVRSEARCSRDAAHAR